MKLSRTIKLHKAGKKSFGQRLIDLLDIGEKNMNRIRLAMTISTIIMTIVVLLSR